MVVARYPKLPAGSIARTAAVAWIACALGCVPATMAVAAPARDREAAQVDARFRDLDRSDRPGCSVGVSRRGATVLARGYGMANLDYGSHNTAGTAFYVASVAKQITGLVVALLIHDGVLGIDDDVRTYIPQLPDYGTPVRIEHLLHHTSGVRDYASLASYAGMRAADLLTTADALDFIVKQHQLDFAPGTRWSYSSSNYLLLARVVEKVTGKPFREVAQQRIFEPLGMTHARFREDHASIIPGRATGCVRTAGGLRTAELNGDPVGQGGP